MSGASGNKFTLTNLIATIAIVISLAASLISTFMSYNTSSNLRILQGRDADLRTFEDASKQLQQAGADYVNALNKGEDLTGQRNAISSISARQSIAALGLKPKLKVADEPYVEDYIQSLRDLNNVSRKITKPDDFRTWAESYGRAVDAASSLTQAIESGTGRRS